MNIDYNVDIVMCIDGTDSMSPIIDEVKAAALTFYEKILKSEEENGKEVTQLRTKVIVFRDYEFDSEPMVESDFFLLPEDVDKFEAFVNGIEACGGGDAPENALEAISLALKSDWTDGGAKRRHVIIMFTGAPALELGERASCPNYPNDLPKTFEELCDWLDGKNPELKYQKDAGSLVIIAPEDETWAK